MRQPKISTWCVVAATSIMSGQATADVLLASSQTLVKPGQPVTLTAVASNNAELLPDVLPARVIAGARSVDIELRATSDAIAGRREYSAAVPPELEGLGTIELSKQSSSRLLVQFQPGERAGRIDTIARMRGEKEGAEGQEGGSDETKGVVDLSLHEPALSSHEPMYFVVGTRGDTSARFQLSFKYRIFDPEGWVSDLPWAAPLTGLHFAYTQTSIWDLTENSKPFRDTSYRPSFFYQFGPYRQIGSEHTFSAQTGFEHESNGKDGTASRSINTLFIKPAWRWDFDPETHFETSVKAYGYTDKSDNPDISAYRGYYLWNLRFGDDDGWLISADLRPRRKGSAQVDLSYRLKRSLFADAGGFLHFQYFNGYGESLLDYNVRRESQFRVGFSIVR